MSGVDLVRSILGDRAEIDAPLGALTTYRVGGRAAVLVRARSEEDLAAIAEAVSRSGLPTLVVGKGSNLLVSDRGFPGVAVVVGEGLSGLDIDGTTVRAGGGASLPVVARRTVAAGLTGFEWAVGVPGSVGGAVRMNAGGHGSDMAATLTRVRVFDLANNQPRVVPVEELGLGYRTSSVEADQVVVWAELELAPGDRERGETELANIVRWRRDNQPGGQNAGSVFTNPPGDSAGRLIDQCGLRGIRLGSAHVSDKHCNFIQADDGGRADDVVRLIAEVRRRVADSAGVVLEPEVRLVGFDDPPSTCGSGLGRQA